MNEEEDWEIVSFPYRKFFNYGESNAAVLDEESGLSVFEKSDGSLMTLYYYKGAWRVSTSGSPDASGLIMVKPGAALKLRLKTEEELSENFQSTPYLSFRDLFWKIWKESNYELPSNSDQDKCFMFEMVSPYNQVVVSYDRDELRFHGARRLSDFMELGVDEFDYGWSKTRKYGIPFFFSKYLLMFAECNTIAEAIDLASLLDASHHEGFVVVDKNFNRVKVKSPMYVAVSLLSTRDTNSLNELRLAQILLVNESEEFLTYFPQYREAYDHVLSTHIVSVILTCS